MHFSVLGPKRLRNSRLNYNCCMNEKEIVLETIRALPDNCSLEEIAERIEFMAAVQKGGSTRQR